MKYNLEISKEIKCKTYHEKYPWFGIFEIMLYEPSESTYVYHPFYRTESTFLIYKYTLTDKNTKLTNSHHSVLEFSFRIQNENCTMVDQKCFVKIVKVLNLCIHMAIHIKRVKGKNNFFLEAKNHFCLSINSFGK